MFYLRDFWRRHRRKAFVTVGVFGGGYILYKLYDAHKCRLADLERELAGERANDELIKAQMQAHFENIQRIADTMTLPHAIHYLSSRIAEELDLSLLTERLMKGKGQPNTLTSSEKYELWEQLKILSFMRMMLSVWAMTMLSLYIRVQVNILGRHLYIDIACGFGSSHLLEETEPVDKHDQQQFLASSDYLSTCGMPFLKANMQTAVTEVLKGKQLRDFFSASVLHETTLQILDMFMGMEKPNHWVDYLMTEDAKSYQLVIPSGSERTFLTDVNKFDQLMVEARAVLSSAEFGSVVEISLKTVINALMEDIAVQAGGVGLSSGMPLAKLLPRIAQMGPLLLEEPSKNRFIQIIQNIPEVELFFTLLYSNMPTST